MRGTLSKYVMFVLPLALLGTSGCTKPLQGIRVQYVDRPIITVEKCLKKEDRPTRPNSLKSEVLPTDLEKLAAIALAKVSEYTRYANKTELILDQCQE